MDTIKKIEVFFFFLENGGLHFKIIPREFKVIIEYMIWLGFDTVLSRGSVILRAAQMSFPEKTSLELLF